MSRPLKLTEPKRAEAVRRYRLWFENRPKRICAELGIHNRTLNGYVRRKESGTVR